MPKTIKKDIRDIIESMKPLDKGDKPREQLTINYDKEITELEAKMLRAAENLEFEEAAVLRDKIKRLKKEMGE